VNHYLSMFAGPIRLRCLLAGSLTVGLAALGWSPAIAAEPASALQGAKSDPSSVATDRSISSVTGTAQANAPVPSSVDSSLSRLPSVDQLSDDGASRITPLDPSPMGQVTSVSQFTDVSPTDWAFQALQSLVERYGCVVGYPDKTYRGNRAMTRYEFAAGLNACMDRVNELIAAATADLVRKEDLLLLQKLQEEFAAELATLRGRVGALEVRTATLEKQQFSTTTKLNGQVIMAVVSGWGGASGDGSTPKGEGGIPTLVDRVRLDLKTSFTGKDLLITGLQAYNFLGSPVTGDGSLQAALFPGQAFLTSGMTKLGFEPQFPGFDVKTLTPQAANSVNLYKLLYVFPSGLDNLTLFVGPAAEVTDAFPAVTPFYGEGTEAISRFGSLNPVLRVSGGTSLTGLASAAGFIWSITPTIDWRALYGSVNANLPGTAPDILPGVSATPLGAGLFSGSSVIATQLTLKPFNTVEVALNYAHSYHEINILGTGLSTSSANALGGLPVGIPVQLNSFGGTLTWNITPQIAFSTYGAWILVNDQSSRVDASSNFSSWMTGFHFKDVLKKGSSAGLLFGQPLYRYSSGGDARRIANAVPYQLEAYYRYQVTDNISITPGVFVIFNPEGLTTNDTTTVGVLRTTFTF